MNGMVRRATAVAATIRRFDGRPFAFGSVDCVKMAAFHLRAMGHREALGLAKAGTYRSALSARGALKRAGYDSVPGALDALGFARIAPAEALPGDLIQLAGEHELAALGLVVGNGRVFAFHQDAVGPVLVDAVSVEAAWRITPR
jgi:hypothetical protein